MGITVENRNVDNIGTQVHHNNEGITLNDISLHQGLQVALEKGTIAREEVEMALEEARQAYETRSLEEAGVSPEAFFSSFVNLVYQESSYIADADSGHAFGYAQLKDNTAKDYTGKDADNLAPTENLSVGAQYLADLITGNDDIDIPQAGSLEKALVAYNGGYDALQYAADGRDANVSELTIEEWLGFMETMRDRHGEDAPGKWRDQTYEYVKENLRASGNTREADSIQHAEAPAVAQTQAHLHMLGFQGASGTELAVDGVMGKNTMHAIEQAELQYDIANIYDDNANLNLTGDDGINAQLREIIKANEDEIAERIEDTLKNAPSHPDSAVEAIQVTLNALHDEDLKTDGIKGPKTVEAAQQHYDISLHEDVDHDNQKPVTEPDEPVDTGQQYTIQPGDTLSGIIKAHYSDSGSALDWVQVKDYASQITNKNENIDTIHDIQVGQKIFLPSEAALAPHSVSQREQEEGTRPEEPAKQEQSYSEYHQYHTEPAETEELIHEMAEMSRYDASSIVPGYDPANGTEPPALQIEREIGALDRATNIPRSDVIITNENTGETHELSIRDSVLDSLEASYFSEKADTEPDISNHHKEQEKKHPGQNRQKEAHDTPDSPANTGSTHVVESGESLSVIVQDHYDTDPDNPMSVKQIQAYNELVAKHNGVDDPNKIKPGQELNLPQEDQLDKQEEDHQNAHQKRATDPQFEPSQDGLGPAMM